MRKRKGWERKRRKEEGGSGRGHGLEKDEGVVMNYYLLSVRP